jgi:hypothetical protein
VPYKVAFELCRLAVTPKATLSLHESHPNDAYAAQVREFDIFYISNLSMQEASSFKFKLQQIVYSKILQKSSVAVHTLQEKIFFNTLTSLFLKTGHFSILKARKRTVSAHLNRIHNTPIQRQQSKA